MVTILGVYTLRVGGVSMPVALTSCGLQPPVAARILCSGRLWGHRYLYCVSEQTGHVLTHRRLYFYRDLESPHETNLRFLRLQ